MADSKAQISRRQGGEWASFRRDVLDPLYASCAGGELKDAKLLADTIKICHEGERKAFDYGEGAVDTDLTVAFEE